MASNKEQKFRRYLLELDFSHMDSEKASEELKNTPKYKKVKADSDVRMQIQNEIKQMAKNRKGRIEILTYLLDVYPYPEYRKYYRTWIDNWFKKLKIKEESDEGRENE